LKEEGRKRRTSIERNDRTLGQELTDRQKKEERDGREEG